MIYLIHHYFQTSIINKEKFCESSYDCFAYLGVDYCYAHRCFYSLEHSRHHRCDHRPVVLGHRFAHPFHHHSRHYRPDYLGRIQSLELGEKHHRQGNHFVIFTPPRESLMINSEHWALLLFSKKKKKRAVHLQKTKEAIKC